MLCSVAVAAAVAATTKFNAMVNGRSLVDLSQEWIVLMLMPFLFRERFILVVLFDQYEIEWLCVYVEYFCSPWQRVDRRSWHNKNTVTTTKQWPQRMKMVCATVFLRFYLNLCLSLSPILPYIYRRFISQASFRSSCRDPYTKIE